MQSSFDRETSKRGGGGGENKIIYEDFHYVAMIAPPSLSMKALGSLVITTGQNGVLLPSRSSTKTIDVTFTASGSILGKFDQELWVVSLADRLDQKKIQCTAMIVPSQSQFINFPDLKYDVITGTLQQLELGLIQIRSASWYSNNNIKDNHNNNNNDNNSDNNDDSNYYDHSCNDYNCNCNDYNYNCNYYICNDNVYFTLR